MTNPTPTPPERAEAHERSARSRYPWHLIQIDQWQEWQNLSADVTPERAIRDATRLRMAAHAYAARNELRVAAQVSNMGRTVDLKFTRREA